jgi:hypothetical protein
MEKRIYPGWAGHPDGFLQVNQMNDGAKQGDFLGQEKLILGHNETNYGTNRVTFRDRRS